MLVAVARYGSVTAAAQALNYAQPSVSHHIARLEAETGARLLQRAGRGVRLTDAGRLLAERPRRSSAAWMPPKTNWRPMSGFVMVGCAWPPFPPRSARSCLRRPPGPYAGCRWIAGCDRCRTCLLRQCALAGFTPKIAFTTDDYVAVQALVAAGLGITTLPGLALRSARHPGICATPLPGARRHVFAITYGEPPDPPATTALIEVLASAAAAAAT